MKKITSLESSEFTGLFTSYKKYAFRLETLQEYAVSYEDRPFRDFLAGHQRYTDPDHLPWVEMIADNEKKGLRMSRVHVVEEPLTNYLKFEILWPYKDNVDAGDDIRILPVAKGEWPKGLPHEDFWLFDDNLVAKMKYDEEYGFVEALLTDEKNIVDECIQWMKRAKQDAISYDEYVSRAF
jgi:hypothetical protein